MTNPDQALSLSVLHVGINVLEASEIWLTFSVPQMSYLDASTAADVLVLLDSMARIFLCLSLFRTFLSFYNHRKLIDGLPVEEKGRLKLRMSL